MEKKFDVLFLEEAVAFLDSLDPKAREKVIYNIRKAQVTNSQELFKKLNSEIWEFRTLFDKTHYRLFAFWDKTDARNTIVISTHGLVKKSDKTPQADLERAEKIRRHFFNQKPEKK